MRIFKIDELQYEESISNRELGKQRKRKMEKQKIEIERKGIEKEK